MYRSRRCRRLAVLVPVLLHGTYDFIATYEYDGYAWIFVVFVVLLFAAAYRRIKKISRDDRFIDDSRYAEAFVREKLRLSGWGEYKIRTALQRKGVSKERIDAALSQADRPAMGERLAQQLERKARTVKYASPYELKTKLIRYGLSLGYDYEAVMDAASAMVRETDTCNDF